MAHVSNKPKFDSESKSGNQKYLARKYFLKSGNCFTNSQSIYMKHISRPNFYIQSESGNQKYL